MNQAGKPIKSSQKLKSIRMQPLFARKPQILILFPQTQRNSSRSRAQSYQKDEKSLLKYFYLKQKFQFQNILKKYGVTEEIEDIELKNFVYQVDSEQNIIFSVKTQI